MIRLFFIDMFWFFVFEVDDFDEAGGRDM